MALQFIATHAHTQTYSSREFAGLKKEADSESESGELQRGDAQLQAMEILFADFVFCWFLSSCKT